MVFTTSTFLCIIIALGALATAVFVCRYKMKKKNCSNKREKSVDVVDDVLNAKMKETEETREIMLSILEDTEEAKRELQKTLEDLKKTQGQLVQAGRLSGIGQMAAGVAHEINNPLTSILGYAQLMIANKNIDNDMKEDLSNIEKEAKRCVSIIENVLNFAKPMPVEMSDVDIREVLDGTLRIVEYTLRREKINIVLNYSESLPLIKADGQKLQQVFMNIVINALHSMSAGGELKIEAVKSGENVVVSIIDTGEGMTVETLEKIFDPFFTTSYERGQKGTGLGLSISHSIIKDHGGEIEVDSALGKGTVFRITLPIGGVE